MVNDLKMPRFSSLAFLLLLACGSDADADANGGPPPFQSNPSALPVTPAVNDGESSLPAGSLTTNDATTASESMSGNEGPSASEETPVDASMEMQGSASPLPQAPAGQAATADMQTSSSEVQTPPAGGPDPNFLIFLLIGQSNMEGAPASDEQDRSENPRVKVLALRDCPERNQVRDEWYTAAPSLHACGNRLGPGDYFAKTLAEALPDATIGLVPDAIAGVDIDIFRKGVVSQRRDEFFLPPDNQRNSAYETVIERARLARQVGVIRGILFHQGESDAATGTLQMAWPGKVQGLVQDLRADLGLNASDVPFLAGELLANGPPQNGCCGNAMNPRINMLPGLIPNAFVISGAGLGVQADGLHYNAAGQREFGRLYAQSMLEALEL
jgi:hypothetical protein